MAEYIEREAAIEIILRQYPEPHYPNWYVSDIKRVPAADVVSKSLYDQIKWERDTAISQLESYGVGLGEKADVVEVVRCKDCCYWEEVGIDPITNYRFGYCRHYQWQGEESFDRETNNNDYCSYGRKRG